MFQKDQNVPERDLRCIFAAVADLPSAEGVVGLAAETAIFVVLEVDEPACDADEDIC
jgi:hypothetical protein